MARGAVGYVYITLTVLLTVYGQLAFKWQIDEAGSFPSALGERVEFIARLAVNPWIVSVFAAALVASLTWGAALTKFELSHAYPFMSLSFVLVLLLSVLLFSEALTAAKVLGVLLIMVGLTIGSQS